MIKTPEGFHSPGAVFTRVLHEFEGKRGGTVFSDILGRTGVIPEDARVIDARLAQMSRKTVTRTVVVGDSDETGNQVVVTTTDYFIPMRVVSRTTSDLGGKVYYSVRWQTPEEMGLLQPRTHISSNPLRRSKYSWTR